MIISRPLVVVAVAAAVLLGVSSASGRLEDGTVSPLGGIAPSAMCGDGSIGVTAVTVGDSDDALARQAAAISSAGFSTVRLPIEWPKVELSQGSLDWSEIDKQVDSFLERGVRVLGAITWAPTFAVQVQNQLVMHPAPADPVAFAEFARQAVVHFNGRITTYEIWNEPNVGAAFGPKVDVPLYAQMLIESYRRIKEVDPTITVLTGGTSPTSDNATDLSPGNFIRDLYLRGAGGSFDGVAMHPYSYVPLTEAVDAGETGSDIALVRAEMENNGDSAKKIWFTEFGVPTGGPLMLSEADQTQYLVNGITYLRSLPYCGGLILFDFRDVQTGSAEQEYNFGLVRTDYSPKAALAAVQSLM